MDRAALQLAVFMTARKRFLEMHFRTQQVLAVVRQMRQHNRRGFIPPVQTAQIRLVDLEVARRYMHLCQHGADCRTMHRGWRKLVAAFQFGHDRRWFAMQRIDDFAIVVGNWRRHQYAALRQMAHQMQIEG